MKGRDDSTHNDISCAEHIATGGYMDATTTIFLGPFPPDYRSAVALCGHRDTDGVTFISARAI